MLLALLLPDPCDELCPAPFKAAARKLLTRVPGKLGTSDKDLRKALLRFIGDFANWDLSTDQSYLEVSRGLVKAAHPQEPPLVVDPFAGGGSIPLEALRLGCEAFASDLNPVACLILKVMLEDIPRHGVALAEEVRKAGAEIRKAAEEELGAFYPGDPDGARPIAYLWSRTVRCEAPNCGAEIPLMRSRWLTKKASRKQALRLVVKRPRGEVPHVEFEIFTPKQDDEVAGGTVTRAKATCVCCGLVLAPDRVRAQLREQMGGAEVQFDKRGQRIGGARLLAVVTLKDGDVGRRYRLAVDRDYAAVRKAAERLVEVAKHRLPGGLSPVPDEPTPGGGGSGAGRAFSVQKYGMMRFGDLFTARQRLALVRIGALTTEKPGRPELSELLASAVSRLADKNASLSVWNRIGEKIEHVFGRQALPIVWDFAEVAVFSDSTGNYESGAELVAKVADAWRVPRQAGGQVQQGDAAEALLPDGSVSVWFTDPPYYDAVPYADLSDFFLVWLKRTLPGHPMLRDPYDQTNPLSHKVREAVQDETKLSGGLPKNGAFFEATVAKTFAVGRRGLRDDGVGCVVFAHKTTEGWEALLSGMIRGGWTITGSWPIATERPGRLRSQDSAALATSVHLVCRPRIEESTGDWAAVFRELPKRVREWMERLENEGVRGADLVFACIGPALEIYSRYARVEDAEGNEIPLGGNPEAKEPHKRGYLAYVWEVVGRTALEQVLGQSEGKARNGAAGALEEDARLTALFLWTLQSTDVEDASEEGNDEDEAVDDDGPKKKKPGLTLAFDVVRRFAQPLGIHLPEWERRIIEIEKGVVRLLPVAERAESLFGEDGASAVAAQLERSPTGRVQIALFPDEAEAAPKVRGRGRRADASVPDEKLASRREATTLDRVHAAMLLQKAGRTNALRALLAAEVQRGSDFVRLANALSALYPKDFEEKRLLDAMLLAVPG
jgi:adenine-specific DNA methylase